MRRAIAGWALAAALAGCAHDAAPGACESSLKDSLDAWGAAGFSGSIAIVGEDGPQCLVSYGLADRTSGRANTNDTVFSIGSISKAFTAAAVLDLATTSRLALDDRVGDLVPGLDGPVANATVEQLLQHTSGLVGSHGEDHEPLTRDEAIENLSRLELAFPPGSDHLYSNAGYSLLALVIEERSTSAYRDHIAGRVLPLPGGRTAGGFWDGDPAAAGPRAIGYDEDGDPGHLGDFDGPHWALAGNGDLAMTAEALAEWTHALHTGRILSPEVRAMLARPGVDLGDGGREAWGWVSYDASVLGAPVTGAAGGGGDTRQNAVALWLPETERAVAIASNTAAVTAEDLAVAMGGAIATGQPLDAPPTSAGSAPATDDVSTFAGSYALPSGDSLEVSIVDGALVVAAEGPSAIRALRPLPPDLARDAVDTHERLVRDLLAGTTGAGRDEVALLEEDLGRIEEATVLGSVVEDGELRTYVELVTGTGKSTVWYAVNDSGGIEAAEIVDLGPHVRLRPVGAGEFAPDDSSGAGAEVRIRFGEVSLTITVPGRDPVTAPRTG